MAHTTKYGNTYSNEEWQEVQDAYRQEGEEATRFFELKDELITKAANFLNREFPDVSVNTFKVALNQSFEIDGKEVKFSSEEKAQRFQAAQNWINTEIRKI